MGKGTGDGPLQFCKHLLFAGANLPIGNGGGKDVSDG